MKYCGKERGSITLFLALILSLLFVSCMYKYRICTYGIGQNPNTQQYGYRTFILYLDSMTGNFLRNMICLRWMVPWEAGSLISQRSAIIWNPI